MMGDGDLGGGWWLVMVFGMILFWAMVIGGIVWTIALAARGGSPPRSAPSAPESPREILDRRLAHGEITPDDHARLRALIARDAR